MIDVYEDVKDLLKFESEYDFYYLQLLQRKKENPELGSNSRVIKNYYINSLEYLEERYDEIKELCIKFNARAMLRLNKRSYYKVAYKAMQNMANCMANGEFEFVKKSYDRACGNGHNDSVKKWIVDIDEKVSETVLKDMEFAIRNIEPFGDKVLKIIPTKNGWHLITTPFNQQRFGEMYENIDIHKDNPINLFIP